MIEVYSLFYVNSRIYNNDSSLVIDNDSNLINQNF